MYPLYNNETFDEFYLRYSDKIIDLHYKMREYCEEISVNVYDKQTNAIDLYNFIIENTEIIKKINEGIIENEKEIEKQEIDKKITYNEYIEIVDNEIIKKKKKSTKRMAERD